MTNLQRFYKGKKVLVTGHTGFKGGWLTQILLLWGADVTGIALRPSTNPSIFKSLKTQNRVNNYFADVRDLKKIRFIFKKHKPEIVFHLAAQPIVRESYNDPVYTFETNTIGTANVLEAIRNSPSVRSAVMITTDKVYENKETRVPYREGDRLGGYDPYSSSKACAELIIGSYIKSFFNPKDYGESHKTLVASVRAGNVIGGGDWSKDRIMTDVVRSVFETNTDMVIRSPNAVRPWQYVLEPLAGYLSLGRHMYGGEINFSGSWNFGPGSESHVTVRELMDKAVAYLNRGSYVINEAPGKKHEAVLLKLNSSKAQKHLGWKPVFSASEALKLTLDWYRSYYEKEDMIKITNQQIAYFFNKNAY